MAGIEMKFVHTPAMCAWMKVNYMLPAGNLAIAFNNRFGTARTPKELHTFRKRLGLKTGRTGQFQKGHVPANAGTKGVMKANSGSFKKGQTAINSRPVGAERINRDGYIEIKVAEPNKWQLKQRVVWEKHNGKLAAGHCVTFKDNDPLNCEPENLQLISRGELAVLNKRFGGIPVELKPTARAVVTLIMKSKELSENPLSDSDGRTQE
ncbi:HNH endonuclease [Salmonella enterica]|uniref:HNH endonuclease signature motif containing protein n=1 Tax=Citrobacter TaxID=544 RepID=UPI002575BF2A|nr:MULTISPECIES: HNH endonuclease signature motif containing protein [unclassified Citrobacter]EEE6681729.1 HNH endonuclease [Salmonella enterica subsp. diarizonae]MDJ7584523.1 HNH endonuclease [Salmonella enterica]MDM2743125.1 HNH endonuclease [Citrobacter sp. Cu231]MDM3277868.1 HNH endonuclease [Citrobacter sp. Ce104]